jgi:hypothetical protein
MTPQEILDALYIELERLYGKAYADACTLYYRRSWFYASLPKTTKSGRLVEDPYARPFRKADMLSWLEELRALQPKE